MEGLIGILAITFVLSLVVSAVGYLMFRGGVLMLPFDFGSTLLVANASIVELLAAAGLTGPPGEESTDSAPGGGATESAPEAGPTGAPVAEAARTKAMCLRSAMKAPARARSSVGSGCSPRR